MQIDIDLTKEHKEIIKRSAKRLAEAQAAFLKVQNECFGELLTELGYNVNSDTFGLIHEGLTGQPESYEVNCFSRIQDWAAALTRYTEAELLEQAEAAIEERRKKLKAV